MISDTISKNTDSMGKLMYAAEDGYFVVFSKEGNVQYTFTCRDEFFSATNENTNVVGFHCNNLDIKAINHFFEEYIESKLGLKESIVFHGSSIQNLVVIELPKFWCEHIVRRSLFSLFLRCAAIFYKTDFNQAIDDYSLARVVKEQVSFFLEGNIFPTFKAWRSGSNGFVREFNGLSKQDLAKKLTAFEVKNESFFMQEKA